MDRSSISARLPLVLAAALVFTSAAHGQLRIVDYNTAGVPSTSAMTTVLTAIGNETVNGVAKPIDVLILQELSSGDMTTMLTIMNGLGVGTYVAGSVGSTTGAGSVGMIYRAETVDLISQTQAVNTSPSGAARGVMRYEFRPEGYDDSADFYIYGSHYKSSDTPADAARRNVEAQAIRNNANGLGEGAHIIYTGDFNIYRSTEPMWATLTYGGAFPGDPTGYGKAVDPVNQVGHWHDTFTPEFKLVHTQNPAGSGFVGGGMDDRFDWQMVTDEMMDSEGVAILAGSYHAFGNNGTHSNNGHINTGSGASPAVLNALGSGSDHLPVVAQYQVPAKMGSYVSAVPSQVIVGASLSTQVTVANTAGEKDILGNSFLVKIAAGADELDYTIGASGAATGSANGTKAAEIFDNGTGSAHGNSHAFSLSTATAGAKLAEFDVTATSPQVPNANQDLSVSYDVLDHANASFASGGDQNSLTIDFGEFLVGSGDQSSPFSINNLLATDGFTAALDSILYSGSGDTSVLTTDLLAIDDLAADSGLGFNAIFDTSTPGNYSATYTLTFSDDTALLGATTGPGLTLNLLGEVITAVADADFDDDSDVDADDIDILADMIFRGASDPGGNDTADLDGVGGVTQDDMDYMVSTVLETVFGDSDLDDDVDGGDLDAWRIRDSEGGGIGWATGDWDGDNDVDGSDFDHWRERLPAIGGAGVAAVPEPATWVLMSAGLTGLGLVCRRRQQI